MMRRLLHRLFGLCAHKHPLYERDGAGVLWLVCDCGHKAQLIRRDLGDGPRFRTTGVRAPK